MATTNSTFLNLPNDLLRRILVGVPLEDHRATVSVCRGFRDVINDPKFLALRQTYGFAERGVVLRHRASLATNCSSRVDSVRRKVLYQPCRYMISQPGRGGLAQRSHSRLTMGVASLWTGS